MLDAYSRTRGWLVPPAAVVAVTAVMVGAVFVVRSGDREQRSRAIPAPRSAEVTALRAGRVEHGPTSLSRIDSVRLATIVDRLPHRPHGGYTCGSDNGRRDRIVFATASGAVVVSVDLGGCLGVTVASRGSDRGADEWDPDAMLKATVAATLGLVPGR